MARTTRAYSGAEVDGSQLPRYFAKSGHFDQDPTKVKKDGHGKGNWGKEGDELDDIAFEFNFHRQRRHSNSANSMTMPQSEVERAIERHELEEAEVFDEEIDEER